MLNIGDPAPPLRVGEWLKGTPVHHFEKGHVYVVEFWATWCKPCIAMMPNLSAFAGQYKDKVTIIGIDIKEKKTTSIQTVKAFVDSMGYRMDYHVAAEDSNFTVADWLETTGEQDQGIPRTFVVNAEGRLAWIGHPKDLDDVLSRIVNETWNIQEALTNRNENKRLETIDHSLMDTLNRFAGYPGKPDSALLLINEIISKDPNLKYAPHVAHRTFWSLLLTNLQKAYQYGKVLLVTPTYEEPAYEVIIDNIEWVSKKVNLPAEIYALGAEAYQAKIHQFAQFGNMNIPKNYNGMAEMYWLANNKVKAIDAMQKAIEALKSKKGVSSTEMAAFKSRLQQYKNM